MAGEIPSPTFQEEHRIRFLTDRFIECGLQNISTDEQGNALGILPGNTGERNIVVTAHVDTPFDETVDHTISVEPDVVIGPGVGENSLGVAALTTLPDLIAAAKLDLDANLIFVGSTQSLGRGDMRGLRFFLDNKDFDVLAGICVESVELSRLSYESLGMIRGDIRVAVPESFDWTRFGAVGAIGTLNEIINHINHIRLPQEPRTRIMLGRLRAGTSSSTVANQAELRFEIRSESSALVDEINQQFADIIAEVSSRTGSKVDLDVYSKREPGTIGFTHPLTRAAREIQQKLGIEPRPGPSVSELSAFIYRDIPALTLGLTKGHHFLELNESLEIEPMFTGLAQLLGILKAIDEGACDED